MAIDPAVHSVLMSLSSDDKALVAKALLDNLDPSTLTDYGQDRVREAEQRLDEYKRGEATLIPFDESMRRVGLS